MRIRLLKLWEDTRSSYWFIPGLMAGLAIAASFLTLQIDQQVGFEVTQQVGFIWSGGAEGARGLLSTVAGSMITVAGTVFSIVIVAFTQASSQFGPRLLRNFMRDAGNQFVLGTFVGTFLFSLLILRTIRTGTDDRVVFVPYISVTIGFMMAVASIIVLIYFIHHAALSIQAPTVIHGVAEDLFGTIERMFPAQIGKSYEEIQNGPVEQTKPEELEETSCPIEAQWDGYLQAIDEDQLLDLAIQANLTLIVLFRPGHFVLRGNPIVLVWPKERCSEQVESSIHHSFAFGNQRTHTQDVEYGIHQLAEVAVRALSPGTNDPYTAMTCLDWLGAALARLAEKEFPSAHRYDRQKNLRVIIKNPISFSGVVDAAFNQIRQNAGDSTAVRIRMLEVIERIISRTQNMDDRQALMHQAMMIEKRSQEEIPEEADRRDIALRFHQIQETVVEEPIP